MIILKVKVNFIFFDLFSGDIWGDSFVEGGDELHFADDVLVFSHSDVDTGLRQALSVFEVDSDTGPSTVTSSPGSSTDGSVGTRAPFYRLFLASMITE